MRPEQPYHPTSSKPCLGEPVAYKGDGSPIYNCPTCGGRRKLEVSLKGLWYCHKCGVGGKTDAPGGSSRASSPRDYYFEKAKPTNQVIMGYLRSTRKLGSREIRDLRPHTGHSLAHFYSPVYAWRETLPCYWVGRMVVPLAGVSPYWYPPSGSMLFRKTEVLWGLHRIPDRPKTLVLCEGIFDAVHRRDRVALLGKHCSEAQARIVRGLHPREVVVMLDGDAKEESIRVCEAVSRYFPGPIYQARLPEGEDPDSYRKEVEVERLL